MFAQPLPTGEEKVSIEDAQRDAPFTILRPQLGDPLSVWLLNLEYEGKPGGSVALVYETPSYGRVVVMETLDAVDFTTRAAWDKWAEQEVANTGKPGVSGSSEFVTLRGQQALMGVSESGLLGLRFFENGVEFSIISPSLSKDQVVAIAEGMA